MPGWATTKQLIWESLHTAPPKSYAAARAHHATILKVGRHVDVSELLAVLNTIMGPLKEKADKEAAKADTQAALQAHGDDKTSASNELMATVQTIQALHTECDFIMKFYAVRQEARASEINALGNAKAVLSGSEYSLLQTTRSLRGKN